MGYIIAAIVVGSSLLALGFFTLKRGVEQKKALIIVVGITIMLFSLIAATGLMMSIGVY